MTASEIIGEMLQKGLGKKTYHKLIFTIQIK